VSVGGYGVTGASRVSPEQRMALDRALSDRHRKWGTECPAVDMDFVLCEFNHGHAVAIIDYKHHAASLGNTNDLSYEALKYLSDTRTRRWLPFVVARYWPDLWAFQVTALNPPAVKWLSSAGPVDYTEQQFVRKLYALRKEVLSRGDERHIDRLNDVLPPPVERTA
jgi:hypothetical protein